MVLLGLSLRQPYASLVELREKRWETRSWSTGYRGPLVIHASAGFRVVARRLCGVEPFRSGLGRGQYGCWFDLPLGAVVAVVDVVGCEPTEAVPRGSLTDRERYFGDWSPGRFALELANVRRVSGVLSRPLLCRGRLGLWRVPGDLEAVIRGLVGV